MTAKKVAQAVSSWGAWPADVADTLLDWNRRFLLSFRRGPDFTCPLCGREIAAHPNGNCVVRPRRKAKGTVVCEDCLIRLARAHPAPATPPDGLDPRRGALLKERRRYRHLQQLHGELQRHHERLHRQIAHDARYIDLLEAQVLAASADGLVAVRMEMQRQQQGEPA